jgi:hypothetical protein
MKTTKIKEITSDSIVFENGFALYSHHDQDCCEEHYLDFNSVESEAVKDLEFDLSDDNFFNKVSNFGIRLLPINGHPISIPGYSINNGYYSDKLVLKLKGLGTDREFDITECQSELKY